jgi:hypothetical protein
VVDQERIQTIKKDLALTSNLSQTLAIISFSDYKSNMAWILCGAGTVFCFCGAFYFYKTVFEKNSRLLWPVIIMLLGIVLIAIGSARYFKL